MGNEIVNYDSAYAAAAAKYAEAEQISGGTFISTRGGVLSFGDEALPGNQMAVVILESVTENTYYKEKFDAENPTSPTCYAFGEVASSGKSDDAMAPHPSMQKFPEWFEPQAEGCDVCPFAEFGSAEQGRGKACQNRRRLALIPAGYYEGRRGSKDLELHLFDDPKHFEQADIVFLKLPVTSVKEYSKFVQQVAATANRPPFGVIARIWTEPHAKYQYMVKFEMLEKLPDEYAPTIIARNEAAAKTIITPYTPPQEREETQQSGVRGLRR